MIKQLSDKGEKATHSFKKKNMRRCNCRVKGSSLHSKAKARERNWRNISSLETTQETTFCSQRGQEEYKVRRSNKGEKR